LSYLPQQRKNGAQAGPRFFASAKTTRTALELDYSRLAAHTVASVPDNQTVSQICACIDVRLRVWVVSDGMGANPGAFLLKHLNFLSAT
jgi:hypothetical protein